MSQFISFLDPPGAALSSYDRKLPSHEQSDKVPDTFREAMTIREAVFVEEQKVPFENELDEDDPRSHHWVVYASVGTSASPPAQTREQKRDEVERNKGVSPGVLARRKSSTANRLAVGTIRLVPPPHPPHPEPGSSHMVDNKEVTELDLHGSDRQTSMHDGKEPYVKLGRLAVLKDYRRIGLSNLLIKEALNFAAANPTLLLPPLSPTSAEQRRRSEGTNTPTDTTWRGLVLVHAQALPSVQHVWQRHGFVADEAMGMWVEEGIEHVGMWKRLEVREIERRGSLTEAFQREERFGSKDSKEPLGEVRSATLDKT
ncbi:hypothetical protein LTR66_006317 [Elasticomyces elasticus]|nr:hypothetical protein LTR66_006317 [Elasticomyces elasticus]